MTEAAREFEHALRHPHLSLRVHVPVLVTRLGQPLPHGPQILVAAQRVQVVGERGQILPGRRVERHVARPQLLGLAAPLPQPFGPLPLALRLRSAARWVNSADSSVPTTPTTATRRAVVLLTSTRPPSLFRHSASEAADLSPCEPPPEDRPMFGPPPTSRAVGAGAGHEPAADRSSSS